MALALVCPATLLAQSDPATIRLFPTTVAEDRRQMNSVALEMETVLQGIIGRLDQQQR